MHRFAAAAGGTWTMRTRLAGVLIGLLLAVAASAEGVPARDVAGELARIYNSTDLSRGTVAYSVVDLQTGQTLASHNADRLMIPASNMKLLTTGAALIVLKPDFAFETRLIWDGSRLTALGSGDPGLFDPDLLAEMNVGVDGLVGRWADEVVAAGITAVDALVVDDRIFDEDYLHPTWPRDQIERRYCAEVSGFNFFGNVVRVFPRPAARAGEAPLVVVEPEVRSWLSLRNAAQTTGDRKKDNALWIDRVESGNEMTLYGVVRTPQVAPIEVTVHNPGQIFAHYFADALRKRGVTVGEARRAVADDPQPQGQTIGSIIRTPLETALIRSNRDSENLYAEALIKRIGREITQQPGSWENGGAVIRMAISRRLSPALATSVVVADGSGMSRDNQVTADLLAQWLAAMWEDEELRRPYVESMAVGGASGTLRTRFQEIRPKGTVKAKSGFLNGVVTLSGYLVTDAGRSVAFSILVNDVPEVAQRVNARRMHEQMIQVLDSYLHASESVADGAGAGDKYGG